MLGSLLLYVKGRAQHFSDAYESFYQNYYTKSMISALGFKNLAIGIDAVHDDLFGVGKSY